jgi:hypothetical protein
MDNPRMSEPVAGDPTASGPTSGTTAADPSPTGAQAPADVSPAVAGDDGAVPSPAAPSPSQSEPTEPTGPATDVTPEADVNANAGLDPAPVSPQPQEHQVLDYSATPDVATPESGNVAGQERPTVSGRAPLVPQTDLRTDEDVEEVPDPTATVQAADDPILSLAGKDDASTEDLVRALDRAWADAKAGTWNVDSSAMDPIVTQLKESVGLDTTVDYAPTTVSPEPSTVTTPPPEPEPVDSPTVPVAENVGEVNESGQAAPVDYEAAHSDTAGGHATLTEPYPPEAGEPGGPAPS